MEHSEAKQMQAATKYVLGQLPPEVRDSFEEHYFDCGACIVDVKAAAAFVDAGRQVLRTETVEAKAAAGAKSAEKGRWLFWLRPAFAAPALLILLVVVGYQNLVTVPKLKSAGKSKVFNSFPLMAANTRAERGGELVKVPVRKGETFALELDFLLTSEAKKRGFDHYLCQLQDDAGNIVEQYDVPAEKIGQEVHLSVQNWVDHPGKYSVVAAGDPGGRGEWDKANEFGRWNFVVDFRP